MRLFFCFPPHLPMILFETCLLDFPFFCVTSLLLQTEVCLAYDHTERKYHAKQLQHDVGDPSYILWDELEIWAGIWGSKAGLSGDLILWDTAQYISLEGKASYLFFYISTTMHLTAIPRKPVSLSVEFITAHTRSPVCHCKVIVNTIENFRVFIKI